METTEYKEELEVSSYSCPILLCDMAATKVAGVDFEEWYDMQLKEL